MNVRFVAVGLAALVAVAGCQAPGGTQSSTLAPAVVPTVTVTAQVPQTVTVNAPQGPSMAPEAVQGVETPTVEVPVASSTVSPPAAGTVTKASFFEPGEEWKENLYSVADKQGLRGMARSFYCGSGPAPLEMRLMNRSHEFTFSVGQSNESRSSGDVMTVQVLANGKQVDVKKVPFNIIQPFKVNVTGVNAVQIKFDAERGTGTGSCELTAVLFDGMLK